MSWALLIALLQLAVVPQPLHAQETEIEDLQVLIVRPSTLEAVFGVIEVEAEVTGPETNAALELFVDGRSRGVRARPPYVWRVDVGQENVEHRFRVVAQTESGGAAESVISTPAIKIDEALDVQLQQLYVTVTRDDARVLDLEPDSFRITDDGRQHDLVTFARGDVPLTASILIDASRSMAGARIEAALAGTRAFIDGMRGLDEAKLVLFSDQVLASTPFTGDVEVLRAPLETIGARGNTAINDHLYLALKLLDTRQGRRVVVLFTDGADLHSVLDMEDVLWFARRSQALIYWIRLDTDAGGEFSTAWRNAAGNQAQLDALTRAVAQSGGRIARIAAVDDIEPAFRDIMLELREQYVLGYYPHDRKVDGSWRKVSVQVRGGGVEVRTRGGYVDR
ncbi:MAG: VWA domain-containing protein [Acidobacteriota bacterium]